MVRACVPASPAKSTAGFKYFQDLSALPCNTLEIMGIFHRLSTGAHQAGPVAGDVAPVALYSYLKIVKQYEGKEKETYMEKKVTVEEWTTRFRAVGLDDDDMGHWHTLFERENPSGHQGFLEWLGLPEERIAHMRAKSSVR
jgi:hypothetical protein